MPLPDLIEIVPLDKPVRAEITVPGSKSITNRALILAALADGEVTLEGALWSEDTQVMTEALLRLGFEIKVEPDPEEFCNRHITVKGLGGIIPNAGTAEKPLELFIGNAGTAARFLAAMVCLGNGVYRLSGVPRMHERPQAALFQALRELGYRVDSANDKLPATIHGGSKPSNHIYYSEKESQRLFDWSSTRPTWRSWRSGTVSVKESSQFGSALLLCAGVGRWKIQVSDENPEESPYIAMTSKLVEVFPDRGGVFQIEPDVSSGSYFLAANWVLGHRRKDGGSMLFFPRMALSSSRYLIKVTHWPVSQWQIDSNFPRYLPIPTTLSRRRHLGDSIMTAIVLAADYEAARATFPEHLDSFLAQTIADGYHYPAITFEDLGRLRLQECDRLTAIRKELSACGATIVENGDSLIVSPSKLHGAEIETYNDHRMAMCFAILGLKVPGIKIKNPACVKKTFPNFFQKLATPPPKGLGATILDSKTGRKLEVDELFAD
jgi:3-phosphoshikimate 1-carboxyvinyltransferase